jgi:aspartyl/asparaginyl beta-hydroxylase (cupin superfamily)
MFYPANLFPFTAVLERHWHTIRDEYAGIRHNLMDWVEKELYGEGWQVFGLFDFPHGAAMPENNHRCPVTTALVSEWVPRHGAVGFSVLKPMTRIKPHQGYAGSFLRCHLGLQVPAGECALQVGDDVKTWQEGRALVFDDRVQHAAWNLTDQERVLLLVDFVPDSPPELR